MSEKIFVASPEESSRKRIQDAEARAVLIKEGYNKNYMDQIFSEWVTYSTEIALESEAKGELVESVERLLSFELMYGLHSASEQSGKNLGGLLAEYTYQNKFQEDRYRNNIIIRGVEDLTRNAGLSGSEREEVVEKVRTLVSGDFSQLVPNF